MPTISKATGSCGSYRVITIVRAIPIDKAIIGFGAKGCTDGTKSYIDNRVAQAAGTQLRLQRSGVRKRKTEANNYSKKIFKQLIKIKVLKLAVFVCRHRILPRYIFVVYSISYHKLNSMAELLLQQLQETTAFIQSQYTQRPIAGIVLGSGLGNFVKEISIEKEILYAEIPHFPQSTVKGHSGKMIFGKLHGKTVLVMAGRFHFYEGYTPQQVSFPVRVMKALGVQTVLLSNAAGAVNSSYKVGDLMIINDHISFFTINPLIGKNEEALGTRFPDMSEPYSKTLIAKAMQIGTQYGYHLHQGVYVAVTGPTFETHAEYRLIKAVGGDVVGMSTVQEVIVARHAGMEVFAISVVTDLGIREDDNIITHEEVLTAASEAEPKLTNLFKEIVKAL